MKKKAKDIQYRLQKERNIWIIYMVLIASVPCYIIDIIRYIQNKCFDRSSYIYIVFSISFVLYLLYAKYSRIKRKILSRYGVRHDAEIVKAKYTNGRGRWAGFSFYYLEIDFTNSRGKKKILYTPAYIGNPNDYLKSAKCSVYEWKGFYVEGDLQVRDEIDYFGYAGIPKEKKNFIWR